MEQTLKVKISKTAYDKLIEMVNLDELYDSIRLVYSSGCCKSAKVDIYLDNFGTGDIKNNINDLPLLYDESLMNALKEITIVFKGSRFWVKTVLLDNEKNHCSSSCKKSCNGCTVSCTSH